MDKRPNILITGTPGTGKTSMSQMLSERTGMQHINVGELVKELSLHSGIDEKFNSFILDEDKVVDELEERLANAENGCIVDFHSCEIFPERWFDLVIVLRVDNTTLYDRLTRRGYSSTKVTENIECEIMEVVLQEARDSYATEIVQELYSQTVEDMENNVDRVVQWLENWLGNQHN